MATDRRRLERLLNVEAMMPTPLDPERFSFWVWSVIHNKYVVILDFVVISKFD